MQLGTDNKKKTIAAVVLGAMAVGAFLYFVLPFFTTSSAPASNPLAATPQAAARAGSRSGKAAKKLPRAENLDPTLRLDLLAAAEKTQYEGNGRNIFVSQAEDVKIPKPIARVNTDNQQQQAKQWTPPAIPNAPPIPLKFYGFASSPGEPKKIFLKNGDDVFVAGEGEIVDRRYKVIRITNTSVEIQDVVNSGPPQNIPLTQG